MIKRRQTKQNSKSEKGFAVLEAVAFLFAFVMLTVYVIDFFTAIHTGILNSIEARTYLFEILEHRADIGILRPEVPETDYIANDVHVRFHAVNDEDQDSSDDTFVPPAARKLTMVGPDDEVQGKVNSPRLDDGANKASIIYIKTGYGICIDANCGG